MEAPNTVSHATNAAFVSLHVLFFFSSETDVLLNVLMSKMLSLRMICLETNIYM